MSKAIEFKGDAIGSLYFTKDLSKFKEITGNRTINLQHVRRITLSLKDNGMLMCPIIVNKYFQVIDGQHRLDSAREVGCGVYYIIDPDAGLKNIHVLNINQLNWSKKSFMEGYAKMGVVPYVKLKEFTERNPMFNLGTCVMLCSNGLTTSTYAMSHKFINTKEVFNEGTWKGRNFLDAQRNADKIKRMAVYFDKYKDSKFVSAILGAMLVDGFDYESFLHKLSLDPFKLKPCTTTGNYRILIEEIYNYKRRAQDRISLR
ncbi:ParB/RepB/Spo0J family partition protein [Tenacibaculum finnmarkense]|uniref:ParB/RepB/Spo0J family partition protein n=1 Tax=Tenacibaculum finnmarkense TaxID=2781243 RepID=UPI001EFBC875|nr:ParB/RepB/Spo0J family partition protein [Tenacibaculum finnmarkense]MCG8765590.1 hypothetical protein [Tenacibaculum finnmarkense]MCG8778492.1 hypothetical protein [Tenacibaculum finnmarkense]MCG8883978.1 hypothetical protein [Tenacibaculum finnmarkense]